MNRPAAVTLPTRVDDSVQVFEKDIDCTSMAGPANSITDWSKTYLLRSFYPHS